MRLQRRLGEAVDEPLVVLEQQRLQRPLEQDARRRRRGSCPSRRSAARCARHPRRAPTRPVRSSCATKLRNRSTSRWKIGPSFSVVPGTRACSASQISRLAHRVRVGFGVALEVHALHGRAALADEREAVGRVAVDQLVRARRRLASGCRTTRTGTRGSSRPSRAGHRGAHDAARAVGADHEVRLDLERAARRHPAAITRGRSVSASSTRSAVTPKRRSWPVGEARGDEVLQRLVLRVQPDAAADERCEVDAVALAGEAQLDAVVAVSRRCATRLNAPSASSISTVPCSRMPARIVSRSVARALSRSRPTRCRPWRAGARAAGRRVRRRRSRRGCGRWWSWRLLRRADQRMPHPQCAISRRYPSRYDSR